jgi:hypothetical protein
VRTPTSQGEACISRRRIRLAELPSPRRWQRSRPSLVTGPSHHVLSCAAFVMLRRRLPRRFFSASRCPLIPLS